MILIVDDDAGFRTLVSALVARAGLEPVEASSGAEAIAAARANRPDLVILDVRLPDTNGYEVCRELRDELGERLPIILVSGTRIDSIDRSAGILVGGDDYVVKPFDPDELLAKVRRLVERSRGNGAPHPEERSSSDLTKRELEVLTLLAAGKSSREITQELVISEKTVSSHLQRVFTKLHVNSRAQAVGVAYRNGLIGGPAPENGKTSSFATEPSLESDSLSELSSALWAEPAGGSSSRSTSSR
jgi:DNA-binding NarL/FixJ family response regulator